MFEWLVSKLHSILTTAMEQGFQPPLRLVTIGTNGSVVVFEYHLMEDGNLCPEVLCENIRDGELVLPVNLYFSDSTNRASLIRIESEAGEPTWVN